MRLEWFFNTRKNGFKYDFGVLESSVCFLAKRSKSLHHGWPCLRDGWCGGGVMGVQYPDWDGRAPRKDPVNRFMRVLNRK
jgi:hypothetical protein